MHKVLYGHRGRRIIGSDGAWKVPAFNVDTGNGLWSIFSLGKEEKALPGRRQSLNTDAEDGFWQ